MEYTVLGMSGIRVSRFCFGSLTLGPLCADLSLEDGSALLLAAFRQGVNFIDTAQQYCTYPYIRAALQQTENPDKIVVCTKTYAYTAAEAAYAIEEARLELRRDQLDIVLLHEVRDEQDWQSREQAWQVLLDARANGVVKALGLSTHSAAVAAWGAEQAELDILHLLINEQGIGVRDGDAADMLRAAQRAKANGKGVFGMKALAGGALMQQARQALLWAFARPELDAVAIGCKDESELLTNLGWLRGEEPPEAAQVRLLDRNMAFDKDPRCHGCGLCVKRCANGALSIGADGMAEWHKQSCLYCGYCIAACPWFCISFC